MRSRVLGAAMSFLSLQLLAAASAQAQGLQPPTPPKAAAPVSSIAHNVVTWFHHVTGTGGHRHRIASSPPLPRPRPAQVTKTPAELPAAAVDQNRATPAVELNEPQPAAVAVEPNNSSSVVSDKAPDAQPAAAAVEPNKMSLAPDTTVEPDKPPTVELNEVQPAAAAVEPNKVSPALGPTVEPGKASADPPAAAVEQNEVPPRASAGAVLRGPDIPD